MTRPEEESAGVAGGESVSVVGERQPEVGGAGRRIDFFSHRTLSRPVPRNSGAPFPLSPTDSPFRVPGFCWAPPGAPLSRINFAPGM